MGEANLNRVREGEALRILQGGLTLVRYSKHEWTGALDSLAKDRLARKTDKVNGSKFLPSWGLNRLVDWISEQVQSAGWTLQPGIGHKLDVRMAEPVGLAAGELVHTIRIVSDGRYVHAYPIQDS